MQNSSECSSEQDILTSRYIQSIESKIIDKIILRMLDLFSDFNFGRIKSVVSNGDGGDDNSWCRYTVIDLPIWNGHYWEPGFNWQQHYFFLNKSAKHKSFGQKSAHVQENNESF